MFIGHFAVGFAVKRAAPEVKLWQALLAATFIDVLWPAFLLLGIETVAIEPGNTPFTPFNFTAYPWSHSLVMTLVWGVLFGAAYLWRSGTMRGALWLGALVVSHWVLDLVAHRPDLPLWPAGPKFGLGLWYSIPATIVVEVSMFAVGLALYVSATRPRDRTGTWSLAILVAILIIAYTASILSPPPPTVLAIAIGALAGTALSLGLAAWTDRHRTP
jgi:hypothetical protein